MDRLIQMCRGIGDPIVSSYARMFIIKAGLNVNGAGNEYLQQSIEDQLHALKWVCL